MVLCLLGLAGCQCRKSFAPPADTVLLPIPDRQWAEGAPDEGWCGETSIQMVALHYGAWVPQPRINALGKPAHVDLWEEDVPTALSALGLEFERAQSPKLDAFLSWIVEEVRRGRPVIVGAKVFPSDHPEWDVDHLMPVVGFSPRGLVFNSNEELGQVEVSWSALAGREGISFVSPTGKFYGYAVSGFRDPGARMSLRVVEESSESVELAVEPAEAGAYSLVRDALDGGTSTEAFTPGMHVTLARDAAARFKLIGTAPRGPGG